MAEKLHVSSSLSEAQVRGHRLANIGYVFIAVVSLWFLWRSEWHDPFLHMSIIGAFFLGIWPMLEWLKRGDESYPLSEVMQFTVVPFYVVPVFTDHSVVATYSEATISKASLLVLIFQATCYAGSRVARSAIRRRDQRFSWWFTNIVADTNLKFTNYTITVTTAWLFVSTYTDWVPGDWIGTLRAIFFGVGILSTFIQARMWGADQLTHGQKIFFSVNILLQIILHCASLLLINGLITLLLTTVGYFSTSRRIPWIPFAIVLSIFAILHNGKAQMRSLHWAPGATPLEVSNTPAFFAEWIGYGLLSKEQAEDDKTVQNSSSLFERASLMQLVCYAVEIVPDRVGYFNGSTYTVIPSQVFPRFIWPGKPSPNDSVKQISVGLGLLSAEEAERTSIAYGLIVESYVNFGVYGIALLGFLLGWGLKKISLGTETCSTLSIGGIFRILCLAWCLNTETTLAVWLSSFYQACIAIFVPLMTLRQFFQ